MRRQSIQGKIDNSSYGWVTSLTLKKLTTDGEKVIGSVIVKSDGSYRTSPLPSGRYSFYNAGVKTHSVHHFVAGSIPCYAARYNSVSSQSLRSFVGGVKSDTLWGFHAFIQVEIPLDDDFEIPMEILPVSETNPLMHKKYQFPSGAVQTATRYTVEHSYYDGVVPRRSVWSGVPGIKFFKNSPVVIPVDYFSAVLKTPKMIMLGSDFTLVYDSISMNGSLSIPASFSGRDRVSAGDVIEFEYSDGAKLYAIVGNSYLDSNKSVFSVMTLRNSNYVSTPSLGDVSKAKVFCSSYSGMDSMETAIETFTVFEEISQIGSQKEKYEYL